MRTIDAVIFDLGGVLVDVDARKGLWHRILGLRPEEMDLQKLVSNDLFIRFGTGKMAPREFHAEVCRILGESWDFATFRRTWCDIFFPIPGMPELLADLGRKVRVGLLSDTEPLHWAFLTREYPFLGIIETPTLSFEIGWTKPAPECFEAASRNVGVPKERCFFTDDLQRNIDGARRAGMQAEVFRGREALLGHLAERGIRL